MSGLKQTRKLKLPHSMHVEDSYTSQTTPFHHYVGVACVTRAPAATVTFDLKSKLQPDMPLRWGICTAGKISHDFVVGLKTLPESEHAVVAVAAMTPGSAQRFATTHSIPRAYSESYEELAKDPEVDVVYIGSIHPKHLSQALMMLDAGKPVLCEKPLTMNSADTAALIKTAQDKGVFLMEAMWTRFFPAIVELRKQIADGAIGEVKTLIASFGFRIPKLADRLVKPELGGGAILDVGVYPIHFATMLFGEKPESIYVTGWLNSETGVDQYAAITLRYSGQRVAQITTSTALQLPNEAFVLGTEGMLKVPSPFWCPDQLVVGKETKEFPLPPAYLPTNFENSAGMCYEAEEVRKCLQDGQKESAILPLRHTQIVADIVEYAMKELGVVYFKS